MDNVIGYSVPNDTENTENTENTIDNMPLSASQVLHGGYDS